MLSDFNVTLMGLQRMLVSYSEEKTVSQVVRISLMQRKASLIHGQSTFKNAVFNSHYFFFVSADPQERSVVRKHVLGKRTCPSCGRLKDRARTGTLVKKDRT